MTADSIRLCAHAKVNLSLYVTGRRPDGYHDIVSVMQGVSVHDAVTVSAIPEGEPGAVSLTSDSDVIPLDGRNLAVRGAEAVLGRLAADKAASDSRPCSPAQSTGIPALHIHIDKRLPVAAGIAGGSGNAAAAMLAADHLAGYPYTMRELMSIGAAVGADVPFSIMMNAYRNREALFGLPGIEEASPAALMKGIGDVVEPMAPQDFYLIMMNPGTAVSTAEAYREIDRTPGPPGDRYDIFYNVFEEYVYGADKEASDLRCAMERYLHADHILLSGSGPTTVAYYKDRDIAAADFEDVLNSGWMRDNWKIWYAFSGGEQV